MSSLFIIAKLSSEFTSAPPFWGKCPIEIKNGRIQFMATVSDGEPRVLQAPGSDFSLSIPVGSPRVYVAHVHTNFPRLKDVLDEECLISALIEVHKCRFLNDNNSKQIQHFILRIPHCLPDSSQLKDIKVRKGDMQRMDQIFELERRLPIAGMEGDHFIVDDRFVTVFTTSLSVFICSMCNKKCTADVKMFLFANLEWWPEPNMSTLKIKSFLCSHLFSIKEFRKVGITLFLIRY